MNFLCRSDGSKLEAVAWGGGRQVSPWLGGRAVVSSSSSAMRKWNREYLCKYLGVSVSGCKMINKFSVVYKRIHSLSSLNREKLKEMLFLA